MNCVVIDDEPLAIDVLVSYLEQLEGMHVVATCSNPLEAINVLSKHQVDLVFLDIEMPNLTGIDLVKTIPYMPQFIFTTAYPQYALEAFNLNAIDYLVKPIPFQRFLLAISKAKERYALEHKEAEVVVQGFQEEPSKDFIFVKSEYENIKIEVRQISHIQGLKDYIKIFIHDCEKPVLTISNFKNILQKLPAHKFLRVHRSYVVNIDYITALQKTKLVLSDIRIPIGDTYKTTVMQTLGVD